MLETIREFALDRLQECGEEDDARDRHAAFFHRFIADLDLHHALPGEAAWVNPVAAEEDNLRRALTRFAERDEALALNDLSAALDVFWWTRSQMAEARFGSSRPSPVMRGCRTSSARGLGATPGSS